MFAASCVPTDCTASFAALSVMTFVTSHACSKMRCVCNILVAEFLANVHVICERCAADDDTRPLQQYLLHQRGCVILRVLSTIGVQVSIELHTSVRPTYNTSSQFSHNACS